MAGYVRPVDSQAVWPTPTADRRAFLAAIGRVAPEVLDMLRQIPLPPAHEPVRVRWVGGDDGMSLRPIVEGARKDPGDHLVEDIIRWAQGCSLLPSDWAGGDMSWYMFLVGAASATILARESGVLQGWVIPDDDPIDLIMPADLAGHVKAWRTAAVAEDAATTSPEDMRKAAAAALAACREDMRLAGWTMDADARNVYRFDCLAAWQCLGWTYSHIREAFWPVPEVELSTVERAIKEAAASIGLELRRGRRGRPPR